MILNTFPLQHAQKNFIPAGGGNVAVCQSQIKLEDKEEEQQQ